MEYSNIELIKKINNYRMKEADWQKKYFAKPTRLYLVGLDGRVVYAAGLELYWLKSHELEDAIKTCITQIDGKTGITGIS